MKELEKIGTEESNYHRNYECRWCGENVSQDGLDKHIEDCKEL